MTSQEIRKQIMGSVGVMENADELYAEADALYGKQDYAQAFSLAKRAAEQGHPAACSLVGLCYINGFGTEKDSLLARGFFEQAARGGLPRGKRNFAVSLMDSASGPVDFTAAAQELAQAVELGDKLAPRILARLHEIGNGVPKDLPKAAELLALGADRGDLEAKLNLSNCYRYGLGVSKDPQVAGKLVTEAAEQGSEAAKAFVDATQHVEKIEMIAVEGGCMGGKAFLSKAGKSCFAGRQIAAFSIAKYPVTVGLWHSVRRWALLRGFWMEEGTTGYVFEAPRELYSTGITKIYAEAPSNEDDVRENRPVTKTSWEGAIVWCNALSELSGLSPVYFFEGNTIRTNARIAAEHKKVEVREAADGYRLPTEIEWEWAARGGSRTKGYRYSGSDNAEKVGLCKHRVRTVGKYVANEIGIHDMCGHIWQWCWDAFNPSNYAEGSRAVRGGAYSNPEQCCTVNYRSDHKLGYLYDDVGFRVARSKVTQD